MMLLDFFKMAVTNILHRKKRSFLTIVGIFIGITAVVSLVSLGQGLSVAINSQFESLGKDNLIFFPTGGGLSSAISGAASGSGYFSDSDSAAVKRTAGIKYVAPILSKADNVKFGSQSIPMYIYGFYPDASKIVVEEMEIIEIERGRLFVQSDKYKCLVGNLLSKDNKIFKTGVDVGDTLKLGGIECRVVGIVKPIGSAEAETIVYIPMAFAKELFTNGKDEYNAMYARAAAGIDVNGLVEPVTQNLRKQRNVKKDHEDFSVLTLDQMIKAFNSILDIVQAVVFGIAAISLLVGGIGIMNTMYTSVLERTKEIGIMKAVGARNIHIILLFLIEAGILGLVGGAIGIGLGIGLGKAVEFVAVQALGSTFLKAYFPIELIIGALAFSFLVGIIAGVFPAKQAAELNPVDSIRYE